MIIIIIIIITTTTTATTTTSFYLCVIILLAQFIAWSLRNFVFYIHPLNTQPEGY